MYTCERAILRRKGENQRLIEAQVNLTPVRELVTNYDRVYLVLKHSAVANELSLDLHSIPDITFALAPSVTVDNWLVSLGSQSLPTSNTVPKVTAGVIKSRDLFAASYHAERIHPTAGAGSTLPEGDLTDMLVTRPDTDYQKVFEHSLWTVNGLFHYADYSSRGLQIKDGGRSTRFANRNQLGLHSTLAVGKVKTYPITDAMIKAASKNVLGDDPLLNGVILRLVDEDLSNKIVMLSLAGILHFANNRYRVTGDQTILVEWWKMPVMEMFYNTRDLIDLSSFEETLLPSRAESGTLDLNQANLDISIRAFLKLPQSFIITIEADNFFYNRLPVEQTALPGRYYFSERPKYPLQLENGLIPEYMTYDDWGQYVIAVDRNMVNRYIHNTRPYKTEGNFVTGGRESSRPEFFADAYLLEMGTEFIE